MYGVTLARPLFKDEDETPYCVSFLNVNIPFEFNPDEDPHEWENVWKWISTEFPGWLPDNYYLIEK